MAVYAAAWGKRLGAAMTCDGAAVTLRKRFSAIGAFRDTFGIFARGAPLYLLLAAAAWFPYFMWLRYQLLPVYVKLSDPMLVMIPVVHEPFAFFLLAQILVLPAAAVSGQPSGALPAVKRVSSRFLPQLGIAACILASQALLLGCASIAGTQLLWRTGVEWSLPALVIAGGLLALVLQVRWSLAFPICVHEGRGPLGSLRGSIELTRNARWSLYASLIVLYGGYDILEKLLVEAASASGWAVPPAVMAAGGTVQGALTAVFLAVCYRDLRGGVIAPPNT